MCVCVCVCTLLLMHFPPHHLQTKWRAVLRRSLNTGPALCSSPFVPKIRLRQPTTTPQISKPNPNRGLQNWPRRAKASPDMFDSLKVFIKPPQTQNHLHWIIVWEHQTSTLAHVCFNRSLCLCLCLTGISYYCPACVHMCVCVCVCVTVSDECVYSMTHSTEPLFLPAVCGLVERLKVGVAESQFVAHAAFRAICCARWRAVSVPPAVTSHSAAHLTNDWDSQ